MAEIFRLPAVSPTMEVGTLIEWRIAEGASFSSGDVIADIGTDKATIEAQIYEDGVLLRRLVGADEEVPVNAPIAIVGAVGEDVDALAKEALAELATMRASVGEEAPSGEPAEASAPEPEPAPVAAVAPAAPAAAPSRQQPAPTVQRAWMGRALPASFAEPPGDVRAASQPGRVSASPLARKIAAERGVDLHRLRGSGPAGRIVRADVESAPTAGASGRDAGPVPADQQVKLTPMRKVIAKRLLASHQDVPTFFLTVVFDMDAMVSLRAALKTEWPDVKLSYNDLTIAAVARALRATPEANSSWTDKGIVRHGRVDVGMAVAVDEGLLTPVLRSADRMTLPQIAEATRTLAGKARDGALLPEDYTGGTFTISNLGMMGIDAFTAIINPPEAGILAVGALQQEPVVVDGRLSVGWRMKATLTCDHRVMDGAVGARFLATLRRYIEQPALLFL